LKKNPDSWIIHFNREVHKVKKILFVFILATLFTPLFVAAETTESEYYSVDLMVTRVSPHPLGYKVVYYDRYAELREVYLPLEWFQGRTGGKAEIIYGRDKSFPYLSLIYKNAELNHLRLYVFDSDGHPTWGTLSRQEDYTEEFDVEFSDLNIEF